MLTQQREMKMDDLDERIAKQPYEKVTPAGIKARIVKEDYMILPNSTVTICNLTLDNKFSVRGEAACVDERNFNKAIGEELAYKQAFNKLWELEGYLLAERRFAEKQ